jgi:hypothetical protein
MPLHDDIVAVSICTMFLPIHAAQSTSGTTSNRSARRHDTSDLTVHHHAAAITTSHSGWYIERVRTTSVATATQAQYRLHRAASRTVSASKAAVGISYLATNAFVSTGPLSVATHATTAAARGPQPSSRVRPASDHASTAPLAAMTTVNVNADPISSPTPTSTFQAGGCVCSRQIDDTGASRSDSRGNTCQSDARLSTRTRSPVIQAAANTASHTSGAHRSSRRSRFM